MASTIQIKRGTGSAVPSGLLDGELALNLDNGKLYYGSGSASVNNFRFTNLTAENYIVSSSVTNITTQELSGSTVFGNSSDDTHTFTGAITASGNISASGIQNILGGLTIPGNGGLTVEGNTTLGALNNVDTTHITASGNISASGDVIGLTGSFDHLAIGDTIGRAGDPDTKILFTNDDINITVGGVNMIDFTEGGSDEITFNEEGVNLDVRIEGNADTDLFFTNAGTDRVGIGTNTPGEKLEVIGNISSSGRIVGNRVYPNGYDGSSLPFITTAGGQIQSSTGFSGTHITASGNISSSGTIVGSNLSGTNTGDQNISNLAITGSNVLFGNVTASGNISASGTIISNTMILGGNRFRLENDNFDIMDGGLEVNGNVTASGNVSATQFHVGTTPTIFESFGALTFGNASNTALILGSAITLGFGAVPVNASGLVSFTGNVQLGNAATDIVSISSSIFLDNNITASGNISSSGTLIGGALQITPTNTSEDAGHFITMQKSGHNLTNTTNGLSFNPSTDLMEIGGNLLISPTNISNLVSLSTTHITASGNISSSGDVTAAVNDNGGFKLGSANALSADANNILYLGNNATWSQIKYGRQNADQHTFVGALTASGEISSSNKITAATASVDVLTGTGGASGLEVTGFVSSSTSVVAKTGSFDTSTNQLAIIPFLYLGNGGSPTETYIPIVSTTDSTNDQAYTLIHSPYDGMVRKVMIRWVAGNAGTTTITVRGGDNSSSDIDDADDIIEQYVVSGANATNQIYEFPFSASFSKKDFVAVTVTQGHTTTNNYIAGTIALTYDTST